MRKCLIIIFSTHTHDQAISLHTAGHVAMQDESHSAEHFLFNHRLSFAEYSPYALGKF